MGALLGAPWGSLSLEVGGPHRLGPQHCHSVLGEGRARKTGPRVSCSPASFLHTVPAVPAEPPPALPPASSSLLPSSLLKALCGDLAALTPGPGA